MIYWLLIFLSHHTVHPPSIPLSSLVMSTENLATLPNDNPTIEMILGLSSLYLSYLICPSHNTPSTLFVPQGEITLPFISDSMKVDMIAVCHAVCLVGVI